MADDVLAGAIERYNAGDMQPAIGGLSAAMRGRLSGAQTARAYYYRGLAYRKAGQPGQAITDLTRALELKELSEAEKSDAIENRQVAYQEAGISEREQVLVEPAMPKTAMAAGAKPPKPAAAAYNVAETAATATGGTWQMSTSSPSATAAAARTEPPRWVASQVSLTPLPPLPPLPTLAPAERKAKPPPATGAIAPFVTQVSLAPVADASPEVHLLVGSAPSRSEAFALAVRLTSQRGAELGPLRPQISEVKFADSAIYRLRLGPFTDAGQALALCQSLRDSGYDCARE